MITLNEENFNVRNTKLSDKIYCISKNNNNLKITFDIDESDLFYISVENDFLFLETDFNKLTLKDNNYELFIHEIRENIDVKLHFLIPIDSKLGRFLKNNMEKNL